MIIAPKEIVRSNRHSLALTIDEQGDLIVKAPFSMPIEKIYSFIQEKQKWIEKKQEYVKSTLTQNKQIVDYNQVFFLGKKYNVVLIKGLEQQYLTKDYLAIEYTQSINSKKQHIKDFFLDNVEQILLPRLKQLSSIVKVQPSCVKIINSKAKWGMCDNKKTIYLNWKLCMLPPNIIDYVIIHELCHIKHLNHSKEFWKQVYNYDNSYKDDINLIKKLNFLIKLF